jgi:hypothetical protein
MGSASTPDFSRLLSCRRWYREICDPAVLAVCVSIAKRTRSFRRTHDRRSPAIVASRTCPQRQSDQLGSAGLHQRGASVGTRAGAIISLAAPARGAPSWAGIVADLSQYAGAPLGFLNPALYALGGQGLFHDFGHDVTIGNNSFAGVPGYNAPSAGTSPPDGGHQSSISFPPVGGHSTVDEATPSGPHKIGTASRHAVCHYGFLWRSATIRSDRIFLAQCRRHLRRSSCRGHGAPETALMTHSGRRLCIAAAEPTWRLPISEAQAAGRIDSGTWGATAIAPAPERVGTRTWAIGNAPFISSQCSSR